MSNEDIHDMLQGACNVIRNLPEKYQVIGVHTDWMGYSDGAVVQVWSEDHSLPDYAEQNEMKWWVEPLTDTSDVVWAIAFNGTALIEAFGRENE